MISEQKKALRKRILKQLQQSAAADTTGRRSAALRSLLAPHLSGKSRRIGLYYPMAHEVDLLPLLREYPEQIFAFPRCEKDRELVFHHVSSPAQDFIPGAHHIPAPAPHLPIIRPEELDILIIPGVAFTKDGRRLGYGGGYYDRFIPRCSKAACLSVAFAEQLVENIPTEAHDCRIPLIIHL